MFDPFAQCTSLHQFAAADAAAARCREVIAGAKRLRAWADSVEAAALGRLQDLAGADVSHQSARE